MLSTVWNSHHISNVWLFSELFNKIKKAEQICLFPWETLSRLTRINFRNSFSCFGSCMVSSAPNKISYIGPGRYLIRSVSFGCLDNHQHYRWRSCYIVVMMLSLDIIRHLCSRHPDYSENKWGKENGGRVRSSEQSKQNRNSVLFDHCLSAITCEKEKGNTQTCVTITA